jgi:hypothetical protein
VRLESIVQALADADVEFVVIGGWAAILNGSLHATRDIDLCYARSAKNHERIVSALRAFHPRLRDVPQGLPFVWDVATLRNGSMFTLITTAGAVDLIAEVPGLGTYEQAKATAKLVDAFDRQIWVLDLRGLIASKRASGRPKDLQALPELEGLLEASGE